MQIPPLNSIILLNHGVIDPIKKVAFLIDEKVGFYEKFHAEVDSLVKLNKGLQFNCINETFSPEHIASFLRQFPEILHKRIALYIIRIFLNSANVDDLVQVFIKPATQLIYSQYPKWLEDIKSDHILNTVSEIQKELGGYDNMQEEFRLIKRKILRSSNEISAQAFEKYLEQHSDVTEVYGFIDQIRLYFLDDVGSVIHFDDRQRHLLYKFRNREIPIHLYGCNETSNIVEGMHLFALDHDLRIPCEHAEQGQDDYRKISGNDKFDAKIIQAYDLFWTWWEKYEHGFQDREELLAWLHEDENAEIIQTYEEFCSLTNRIIKRDDTGIQVIPEKEKFDAAIELRAAKKLLTFKNTTVFSQELTWEDLLTPEDQLLRAKKLHDAWIRSDHFNSIQFPTNCSKKSFVEAHYLAMNIILATSKRRQKWPETWPERQYFCHPDITNNEMHKVIQSFTSSLLDLLPVSSNPLSASELTASLKKYLDLISLAQEALTKFNNREMGLFDPVGGENACQIRAAMFADILNKMDIDEKICTALRQLHEHANKVEEVLKQIPQSVEQITFLSFLEKHKIFFTVIEEIAIIVSSYILTETKVVYYEPDKYGVPALREKLKAEILNERKNLSKKFAAELVKSAQKKLSEFSVIYVQRLALRILTAKEEIAAAALAFNHVKKDQHNRKHLPFYPSMRLLLKQIYNAKTPLVIKIEQFITGSSKPYGRLTLLFGNQDKGSFMPIENPITLLNKGAVIFDAKSITEQQQGTEVLKKKILEDGVESYIFSASADHPHFECKESDLTGTFYKEYREKAHLLGACRDNPSVFMVEHVHCKTVEQKLIEALN